MAGWYEPRKDKGNPEIYFSTELEQHSSSWLLHDWNKLRLLCWTHCNSASLYGQSYLFLPIAANWIILLEQGNISTKGIAWACISLWYRGINSCPSGHRLLVHYWCFPLSWTLWSRLGFHTTLHHHHRGRKNRKGSSCENPDNALPTLFEDGSTQGEDGFICTRWGCTTVLACQ